MKFYSLKSKSLGYFNKPFLCTDDLEAINQLRNAVMSGTDIGLMNNLKDLELHALAEFDSSKGIEKIKPKMVIDCIEIPEIVEMCEEVLNRGKNIQSDNE